jgi:hypothetical protein
MTHSWNVTAAQSPPKIIRMMFLWPFNRLEPFVQLVRQLYFHLLREECMRFGCRLIIIDPYSELDPSQDPRPDTLAMCEKELQRCASTSIGPALVLLLDHTRQILNP